MPHDTVLLAFAEAVVGDTPGLPDARDALERAVGPEGLVDAAGAVANYQRMVRIADSTGLQLDAPVAMLTADVVDELGLRRFPSARNTPSVGLLKRWLGRLIKPLLPKLLKLMNPG